MLSNLPCFEYDPGLHLRRMAGVASVCAAAMFTLHLVLIYV